MNKKTAVVFLLIVIVSLAVSKVLIIKFNETEDKKLRGNGISIMVYDDELNDYIKSDSVPIGNYYLNEEKTNCIAGGSISGYDSENGTIIYNFQTSDACYIYFDIFRKIMPTLALSQTSVSMIDYTYSGYSKTTINYTYDGDGTLSCDDNNAVTCAFSNGILTMTVKNHGYKNENVIVRASEGTRYLEATKVVTVSITCFTEDTEVETYDKKKRKKLKKKIKDIKKGDIVYSYDANTDTMLTRVVKEVHINKTNEITHVYVNGEDIKTTRTHPFYVENLGYVNASALKPGYKLIGLDGNYYEVEKVEFEALHKEIEMYALELENGEAFSVGKLGYVSKAIFAVTVSYIIVRPQYVAFATGC